MGEMIDDGIKIDRIVSFAKLKATTQVIQKGSESVGEKKNEKDAFAIVVRQRSWSRKPHHRHIMPNFRSKPNNEMRHKSRDSLTPIGESILEGWRKHLSCKSKVSCKDIFGRGRSWRDMLEVLMGYVGPINGKSFVSLTNLTAFIKDELEIKPIENDTPVARVDKITRLYMMVWCWERMLSLQPGLYESEDDDAALPYATRWIKGAERNIESHHSLIAIRDRIDHMTEVQTVRCNIAYTAPVFQYCIPEHPEWNPEHFDVDLRTRVNQSLVDLLSGYFNDWRDQHRKLARTIHGAVLRDYALWLLRHGRLVVGNPVLKFYYNVNARGRGEGRGRERGCGRPRGRPRNANVHELFNEPSSSTLVVLSEPILDMSGAYSMRLMELPSLPVDGKPRLAVLLSVVPSSYENEFITIDAHMDHPPGPKVPVMRAKKKWKEILPTKTRKDSDGFRPLDALRKPKGCGT
ncbi:hypothetical protein T459_00805 [Capsicum annuum]|uniref:Aminotransferase-like plant mobile domain-containing protein n=1 Tax=Capsicum annuum TaxID=4072 RepID=A0A2G3AFF5_CAPAN|nr:hypothetical protein T459_00805 [Capsicum annuum]